MLALRYQRVLGVALCGILSACNSPSSVTASGDPTPIASPVSAGHNMMNHAEMMHHGNMDLGPADADYDLRFIDAMIPHHEGAIAMAKDVLAKTQRPELKKLATQIIEAQDQEIKQMRQWRQSWYPKAPTSPVAWQPEGKHMMEMSSAQMQMMRMDIDLDAADANYDLRFINAMIPHHEGAIAMAKDLLNATKRTEMRSLANNIMASQQAEITQMQQWRKAWFKQ